MHTQSNDVQALKNPAPRNASFESVARTVNLFNFDGFDVRVVMVDGDPWFSARDVAERLGYANPQKAVRDHCKSARQVGVNESFTLGPQANIIPERDVYRLVMRSKMPEAERFEDWVVSEVLPSIRKTASYTVEPRVIATLPDFSNPAAAARAWAEQFELQQAANQALAIAAPKAEFVDKYVESTGLKGFRQTAKLLGANEARFREFLLDRRIMYRMGGEWQAYQSHVDAGRFQVKTGTSDAGHAFNQAKFTPKGVNWIAGLWAQYKLEAK
ncbi:phage antirepressor KilAC domain-containing protein [Pseudomonas syringae group genomosp. 3]|uniref:Phage-encoded protein n=1 Tax=Pseudomonas syringae pv. persicae TaxID=237306 RepID=A0AB38EGZ5_9PSED|nr:phage antirepressor KilAC domain-containing protein [Pseudomonas syringae group genomosp. 3]SOQ10361.1 phage-encoded protein [Pseudomonas syringae pv. persicae]SOQ11875.1 phage-encoded protein [Pseudomonas syringae pv. persicae]